MTKELKTLPQTEKTKKEPVVRVGRDSGTAFYTIFLDEIPLDGQYTTYHEVEKELMRRGLPTKVTKLEMVKE